MQHFTDNDSLHSRKGLIYIYLLSCWTIKENLKENRKIQNSMNIAVLEVFFTVDMILLLLLAK